MNSFYALPGFLGQAEDWDPLGLDTVKASAYRPSKMSLWEWGSAFNQSVQGQNFLMGYSLGGRLALHALISNPTQWKAAVLISTHLGLSSGTSRMERLISDTKWACRFATEPWERVIEAWNQQPVFKGTQHPVRLELNYTRDQLASVLVGWSLANQDDLENSLEKISLPILWIAGADDEACASKAGALKLAHPQSQISVIPNAGHRVVWDQPHQLKQLIQQFLKGIA